MLTSIYSLWRSDRKYCVRKHGKEKTERVRKDTTLWDKTEIGRKEKAQKGKISTCLL